MLNDPDGEIDMKLDLEDIGMCLNKSLDNNIHMVEKTTQTDGFPVSSSLVTIFQSIYLIISFFVTNF